MPKAAKAEIKKKKPQSSLETLATPFSFKPKLYTQFYDAKT